mgnify:CR=1 FL=1
MGIFDKTQRKVIDLALTRFGKPDIFDDITLERISTQNKEFVKPKFNYAGLSLVTSLIPLAIIAYLVVRK